MSSTLTDERILEISHEGNFGAFEFGDAQGDKRIAFARAIEQHVHLEVTEEDVRMLLSVANYMRKDDSPRCAADLTNLASRIEKHLATRKGQ